jgi:hypothetical protein
MFTYTNVPISDLTDEQLDFAFEKLVPSEVDDAQIEDEYSPVNVFVDCFPFYLKEKHLDWLKKNHLVLAVTESIEKLKEYNRIKSVACRLTIFEEESKVDISFKPVDFS